MAQEQPVVLGGIIEGILVAVLGVVVASGMFPMSDALVGSILGLITAAVAGITWYMNQRTIPTARLESTDGGPVTRASIRAGEKRDVMYRIREK